MRDAGVDRVRSGTAAFDAGRPTSCARAAWSRLAEPGDGVAGALVGNLGAVAALDWLVDAARSPERAGAALRRMAAAERWTPCRAGAPGTVAGGRADAPGRLLGPPAEGPVAEGLGFSGATSGPRAAGLVVAAVRRWAPRLERLDPEGELTVLGRYGGTFLTPDDPRWPAGFADLGGAGRWRCGCAATRTWPGWRHVRCRWSARVPARTTASG